MISGGTACIATLLRKGRTIEETANLALIPTAAVVPAAVGAVVSTPSSVIAATVGGASQFLGAGVPILGIVDGALTFGEAFCNLMQKLFHDRTLKAIGLDLADLLSSLPIIIKSYEAWGLHLAGAAWQLSLSVAAQGYAIKAAYDLIKALFDFTETSDANDLDKKFWDCALKVLKFLGFAALTSGPTCFTVGFIFLAAAAVVALYNPSSKMSNCFFGRKITTAQAYADAYAYAGSSSEASPDLSSGDEAAQTPRRGKL